MSQSKTKLPSINNNGNLRDSIHDVSNPGEPNDQNPGERQATLQPAPSANQSVMNTVLITPSETQVNNFENLDYSMSNAQNISAFHGRSDPPQNDYAATQTEEINKKLVFSTTQISQEAASSQHQSPDMKKMVIKIDDASQQESPDIAKNYDIPARIMTNQTDQTQTQLLQGDRQFEDYGQNIQATEKCLIDLRGQMDLESRQMVPITEPISEYQNIKTNEPIS